MTEKPIPITEADMFQMIGRQQVMISHLNGVIAQLRDQLAEHDKVTELKPEDKTV